MVAAAVSALLASCTGQPAVQIPEKGIFAKELDATYYFCRSTARWNGVDFSLEGLKDRTGNPATRKFIIGRADYTPVEQEMANGMAVSLESILEQLCQTTSERQDDPRALASYVVARDPIAIQVFDLMSEMQRINQSASDAGDALAREKRIFRQMTGAVRD